MNYLYEIHSYVADYKVTFSVNIWDLATSMRSLILSGNIKIIFSFLVYNSIPNIYRLRSLLLFSRFSLNGYLTLCFFLQYCTATALLYYATWLLFVHLALFSFCIDKYELTSFGVSTPRTWSFYLLNFAV